MNAQLSRRTFLAASAAVTLAACSANPGAQQEAPAKTAKLDPSNPTSVTVWHYYNGAQQAAFDELVGEFNDGAGKDEGIHVEAQSLGSVSDLESAISDSVAGAVGSRELPGIFSSYSDTAYAAQQKGALANIAQYFTSSELSEFVDGYLQEGYFNSDGALYLLPVAKSTETTMVDETDWKPFADATGSTLDELTTFEGIAAVAQRYYEWTAQQSADGRGRAFYGRDSMANYFVIGLKQMGVDVYEVDADGNATVNIPEDDVRRLWDNYYVPYVNGWFKATGKFRSDDVKTGDIIAYTGSTASASYFPDQVVSDDGSTKAIDYEILTSPVMKDGEGYAVQQGAGMAVTASDDVHEYAAVEFLKWFCRKDNNLRFACTSSYLPVRKDANTVEALDEAIKDGGVEVAPKVSDTLRKVMGAFDRTSYYAPRCFSNGFAARKVLENSLQSKAQADAEAVEQAVAAGAARADAVAPYVTDEAFGAWYQQFSDALNDAAAGKAGAAKN